MSKMRPAEFLNKEVYPNIDAVSAGLLDHLNPTTNEGSTPTSYKLDCPRCHKKNRGYYYSGSAAINCNRKNNCESTSLWDVIQKSRNLSNQETFLLFCEKANIDPPENDASYNSESKKTRSLLDVVTTYLHRCLLENKEAMEYLTKIRKFTVNDIKKLNYGYYPSWQEVEKEIATQGCDLDLAIQYNVIPNYDVRKNLKRWKMEGRITGVWRHEDMLRFSLWGRAFTDIASNERKYYFSPGTSKTRPYGWSGGHTSRFIAVEGMVDSDSLFLLDIKGCGLGGNAVNNAQASFLANHGVREFIHMTDSGRAGITGGLDSIMRCEPLGITVFIAQIPEGHDDVDSMRAQGNINGIQRLIDTAILGGEFYAKIILSDFSLYREDNTKINKLIQRAMRVRSTLTSSSAMAFDRAFLRYGINPINPTIAALELATRLKYADVENDVVNRTIKEHFGITIDLNLPRE